MAFYSFGGDCYKVPMSMHKKNRDKLFARFSDAPGDELLLFKSGEDHTRYDTDLDTRFRQESNFLYLMGTNNPGCYATMELGSKKTVLFIPRLPEGSDIWMGKIKTPEDFKADLEIDEVFYVEDLEKYFKERNPKKVHVIYGKNSDSGQMSPEVSFNGLEQYVVDKSRLYWEVVECRVIKNEEELDLMRYANKLSAKGHIEAMKRAKAGAMEFELEAAFQHSCLTEGGARFLAYCAICCSGPRCGTLHYIDNNNRMQDGDMILADLGCEYHCYASDITCSYPANGKFTDKQKAIYNTVLKALQEVSKRVKAGVHYADMHRLAERVILGGLKEAGLVVGDIDEMMKVYLCSVFMPHGLGHLMGVDVHDCGGYKKGVERSTEPGLRSLRCNRVLESGMVITAEPGCYFIPGLIEAAFKNPAQAKFLCKEKIDEYLDFGGVRIEDNLIIREDGVENMTKVPRTVEEIEKVMATA